MIRKIERKDQDEVFAMMRTFYDSPAVSHDTADHILKKDIEDAIGDCPYLTAYIFEEDGLIAGYAMVTTGYSTEYGGVCLWIEDIYIKPKWQGHGIGKAFFRFLEDNCDKNVVRMRLEVEEENVRARKVYESVGFLPALYNTMDKELKK